MRATDGLQTTITLGSVKPHGQAFALELALEISLPMPRQDEHLPDQIEAYVHQAGLEVQRRLFQVLIEKADQELVLQHRHGKAGAGIQRRGTRPFTFKTIFGEVTVERSRISHNQDGTIEIPSATVWNTSHQLAITENLRAAVCDQMSNRSAGKSRADVCQYAGDESLLGRSTVIDIVHQEGEQLTRAQRERARAVLDGASEAQLAVLGPAVVDPDAVPGLVDDDLPFEGLSQEGGFPGGSLWTIPLETCSIVGELTPISIDGGSPMSTITQRIASAFVVLCGRYGDVTKMAHDREQSRQSLYREASQVANAVDGTAVQSRIDELQRQLAGQQVQIQDLQERLSTLSRSHATNRTSSPASPKPRVSA